MMNSLKPFSLQSSEIDLPIVLRKIQVKNTGQIYDLWLTQDEYALMLAEREKAEAHGFIFLEESQEKQSL